MAWRLTHSIPRVYGMDGVVRESSTLEDRTMEISEKAARQQLAFYLQGWAEADPENRRVQQRDGMNGWCLERPDGCACRWCTRAMDDTERHWYDMGSTTEHVGSHVHLARHLGSPVQRRATTEQYRVVDRALDDNGQVEHGRAPTVWSQHFTKQEAGKGLVAAVGRWRNYGTKTAVRHSHDSYMLRWSHRDYALMSIERIP